MKRIGGELMIGTGILHTLVGVVVFFHPTIEIIKAGLLNGVLGEAPFARIARDGFYSSVEGVAPRMAAFWFFFAGFSWVILGMLCLWVERETKRPTPALIVWAILILAACGAAILPLSGFWILLAVALYMLKAARAAGVSPSFRAAAEERRAAGPSPE